MGHPANHRNRRIGCRVPLLAVSLGFALAAYVFGAPVWAQDDWTSTVPFGEANLLGEPRKEDLTPMIRRGVVRVLVGYGRTRYAIVKSRARGFEYELMMRYRAYLKTRVRPRSWPVQFVFIPLPFDELLPSLVAGYGDIAASGLTVTDERAAMVDFTRPYLRNVAEIVVTAPGVEGLNSLDDLSGRAVHVRPASSYAAGLKKLNEEFAARGLAPAELVPLPRHLADEDVLELVDAGALEITISDEFMARTWSKVYDDLVLRDDLALATGGEIAWAVRKDSPELLESLNTFIARSGQGSLLGNILLRRYFFEPEWFDNPLDKENTDRIAAVRTLLEQQAERNQFDWRLLAALAYQESGFDNAVRSPAGAVGLMQVLPATAAAPPISMDNIEGLEANVEAGTRYLAHLRDDYFNDQALGQEARRNFALAAYNAGPTRIRRLRREAAKAGLDPNRWFNNVSDLARRRIGLETVQYVSNINRYYAEFVLFDRAQALRLQTRTDTETKANHKRP